MFALIESCPDQRPASGWTGRIVSFAIHSFVISAALAFTRHVAAEPRRQPPQVDVYYPHETRPSVAPPAVTPPSVSPFSVPGLVLAFVAPSVVPVDIPPPGTVPFTNPADPDPGATLINLHPGNPGTLPINTAPIDARYVEVRPVLRSHPEIRYPEALRQAGIEGRVMVETVLDTLGRAEPALTRVVLEAHELFDREAVAVVLASRYEPARVDGRPVRVRVQVPVNFTLRP